MVHCSDMTASPVEGEVAIASAVDVARVRQTVRRLSERQGFSVVKQTKLVTAASELARNAVKYANGGTLRWIVVSEWNRSGVRLIFDDQGPGIENLDLALSNGWSSGGGLGLGLPGARRLVDEFDVQSRIGIGTQVAITMWR
jgi:serine/threonine-protein kinase RsbT